MGRGSASEMAPQAHCDVALAREPAAVGWNGEPLLYPAPVIVRNTFLDMHTVRSPSLDEFYCERRVVSCPTSAVFEAGCDFGEALPLNPSESQELTSFSPLCKVPSEGSTAAPSMSASSSGSAASSPQMRQVMPHSLEIAVPCLGPREVGLLPSIGSVGHDVGQCKPCAFLHTRGCESGEHCQFCHLCGPEERRVRKKEKRAFFGALKRMKKLMQMEATS